MVEWRDCAGMVKRATAMTVLPPAFLRGLRTTFVYFVCMLLVQYRGGRMRRAEKEVRERAAIDGIIAECKVCRLGLVDKGEPYVVPVCFGYKDGTVYVHAARTGRKLDAIRANPRVCVEFDVAGELVKKDTACSYGMHFRSVIGWGAARLSDDPAEKAHALGVIMRQYTERDWQFGEKEAAGVAVIVVKLETVTGKAG
jgi:uncharacterized protein